MWELKTYFGNGGEEWLNNNDEIIINKGIKRLYGKDITGKWEVVTDNSKLKDKVFSNKLRAVHYAKKLMKKYPNGWIKNDNRN